MNRILICDDEKDIVRAIDIYLKAEGYDTVKAYNGSEALKLLKDDKDIRLVIMDIMMPEMDGIEALAELRKFSNVPVIFLTGKNDKESVASVMGLKPQGYLLKTLPPQEIVRSIDDFFVKLENEEKQKKLW